MVLICIIELPEKEDESHVEKKFLGASKHHCKSVRSSVRSFIRRAVGPIRLFIFGSIEVIRALRRFGLALFS